MYILKYNDKQNALLWKIKAKLKWPYLTLTKAVALLSITACRDKLEQQLLLKDKWTKSKCVGYTALSSLLRKYIYDDFFRIHFFYNIGKILVIFLNLLNSLFDYINC